MTDKEFLEQVECHLEVTKRQLEIDTSALESAKTIQARTFELYGALITIKRHLDIALNIIDGARDDFYPWEKTS